MGHIHLLENDLVVIGARLVILLPKLLCGRADDLASNIVLASNKKFS